MRSLRVICLTVLAVCGGLFAQETVTLSVANVGLARLALKTAVPGLGAIETTADAFSGSFVKSTATFTPSDGSNITTIGQCVVIKLGPPPTPPTVTSTFLDAGPVMNLTGPRGSKQIPQVKSFYSGELGGGAAFPFGPPPPPTYLDPGTYTVDNGGGGADVGPFSVSLTLPETFQWTNADTNLSIDRSAGVDVTWTGGDPQSKVFIGGAVTIINPTTFQLDGGASFSCQEVDSAGHFTVPPEVLSLLPASTATNGVSNGGLTLINGVQTKFDLPGIDQANFVFNSTITRSVEYK